MFSIKFNKQFLIFVLVGLALFTATLPNYANAFWPFSTNADAAANTIQTNSGNVVLRAATNSDPNPNKGPGSEIQTSGGKALLAYAGSFSSASNITSSVGNDRISVYVVRSGDTLSEIADMFGVSVSTIIWANDLKSARDVRPGDTLIILPISGIERIIVKGDTLKSLAKKYNADANEIAQYNGLEPDEPLVVGSTVIIPGGEIPAPPVTIKSQTTSPAAIPRTSGPFLSGYFVNPLPGGVVTQGLHDWSAVDIGAPRGTPIYAAANGTAIIARSNGAWNGGYGNYIVITHPNGTQTLYSHMRNAIVSPGQSISSGQVIGYVGATGRATGAHLHFEVRGAQNPLINCRIGSICSSQ